MHSIRYAINIFTPFPLEVHPLRNPFSGLNTISSCASPTNRRDAGRCGWRDTWFEFCYIVEDGNFGCRARENWKRNTTNNGRINRLRIDLCPPPGKWNNIVGCARLEDSFACFYTRSVGREGFGGTSSLPSHKVSTHVRSAPSSKAEFTPNKFLTKEIILEEVLVLLYNWKYGTHKICTQGTLQYNTVNIRAVISPYSTRKGSSLNSVCHILFVGSRTEVAPQRRPGAIKYRAASFSEAISGMSRSGRILQTRSFLQELLRVRNAARIFLINEGEYEQWGGGGKTVPWINGVNAFNTPHHIIYTFEFWKFGQ